MPRRKSPPLPAPRNDTAPRDERPHVLDSDDDDDDSVFLGSGTTAGTTDTFNGRKHFELCYGDRVGQTLTDLSSAAAPSGDDFDDEIMNPYIMNPFSGHANGLYDGSASLPPSVELPARNGGAPEGESPRPTGRRRRGIDRFDPHAPSIPTQQRNAPGRNDAGLMEMEEEIDFFSACDAAARNDSADVRDDDRAAPSFSPSFSPFPRTEPPTTRRAHFGERSPLSGTARAYPFRQKRGGTLRDGIEALFPRVASALRRGSNPPFGNIDRRTLRRDSPRFKFSRFRLLVVAMAALSAVGTVSTLRRVLYVQDSMNMGRADLRYDGDVAKRPNSLLLKKMERAKKRWWSKNKRGGEIEEGRPAMEVYRQGASSQSIDVRRVLDSAMNGIYNSTQQSWENVQVPVIVQTGEDGSLLIKLPPPKFGLEQALPIEDATLQQSAGSSIGSDGVGMAASTRGQNDDDTVYIKLPYPDQSQRRALSDEYPSKEEVDPPLRGASIPIHDHTNLKRRPPVPLELHASEKASSKHHHTSHRDGHFSVHAHQEEHPGVLDSLRNEFGFWMEKHGKKYRTSEEKERRFHVWKRNHFRISDKNRKHGPCRMTGKAVFGHNIFSDLEPEEFQDRFLTGYRGPRVHDHNQQSTYPDVHTSQESGPRGVARRYKKSEEMQPPGVLSVHHTIQRKLEEHLSEQDAAANGANFDAYKSKYYQYKKKFANGCDWWDVSCMLRWIFGYQYIGGTREPIYDESTYPDALDWRNMGVVSSVHAQGSCGACWAITAVETIESAYAIATGTLLDLAEEEVIACDGSCEMCNGGWPQNAYKYVMKHGGLPVKNADYDGDFLYYLTATLKGESDVVSENDMISYFAQTCPAGVREGGGDGGSGSGSRDKGGDDSNYDSTRYGSIKGYGYATERCVCYTDGSGCDCDQQDEQKAVLNIASYGPAAVCLEASLWQSYEGGIMTSETGCGSAFLDMNHCVQVVGYAFTTSSNREGGDEERNSGSRDRGHSRDGGQREGYWIVKNQWSRYWGMNGYAYLAMGDNTCGILNDMTQVYM